MNMTNRPDPFRAAEAEISRLRAASDQTTAQYKSLRRAYVAANARGDYGSGGAKATPEQKAICDRHEAALADARTAAEAALRCVRDAERAVAWFAAVAGR